MSEAQLPLHKTQRKKSIQQTQLITEKWIVKMEMYRLIHHAQLKWVELLSLNKEVAMKNTNWWTIPMETLTIPPDHKLSIQVLMLKQKFRNYLCHQTLLQCRIVKKPMILVLFWTLKCLIWKSMSLRHHETHSPWLTWSIPLEAKVNHLIINNSNSYQLIVQNPT